MANVRAGWMHIGMLVLALVVGSGRAVSADDQVPHGPTVVLIIRHAEKPANTGPEKDPNLTERGYQRAAALAKVIPENFPRPDFVIATKRSTNSNRPVETVTPSRRHSMSTWMTPLPKMKSTGSPTHCSPTRNTPGKQC